MSFRMKSLSIVLPLVIVFLLTSCSNVKDFINEGGKKIEQTALETVRSSQLTDLMNEESEKIDQMSKEIIRCFTERDKEALKVLFCEQIRNQPSFDDEINKAFEFLTCDVYITSERTTSAGGEESWDSGKRTKWSVWPDIPYIAVLYDFDGDSLTHDMESRYYSIYYDWQIVNDEDNSLEGIQYMKIELLNVDSMEIGDKQIVK
ncbi:DUF5104 domain-containing protein [Sedimentibacter sp. zth1]|uniref:DUF5104 domain-containing protein n=1 Tax=Sedimentibacter sp. zth1 TaxID=2816908 RepID=UPI001A924437|nr:DUF5104 domain-containing protein [Sedimentibacter sp. zth1]QSX04648.1 DUF5104 domain-containing protein [Sedimentibacter sp. zth1]